MIAYHYTTVEKFHLIKRCGLLLPADIGVCAPELPILWFSTHPRYEPSALKPLGDEYGNVIRILNVRELHKLGGGLVRFGIPTSRLKRGEELRKSAKMSATIWRKLEKVGKKMKANPFDWLGHVGSMPLEHVTIEIMDDNMVWRPISG